MRDVLHSWYQISQKPGYIILAILAAGALFLFSIWLPMHELLTFVTFSPVYSLWAKVKILFFSLGSIQTNFTFFSAMSLIVLCVLTGINVSMFIYYFRKRTQSLATGGLSFLGMATALMGIGCASCGSVILTTVFGLTASTAIVSFLPLGGTEFSIIGIGLLIFSIWMLGKKIQQPVTCSISRS